MQLADGILTISAPGKAVEDRFIVGRVQLISGFPIVFSAPCGVAVQIARRITVHARGISSVVVKIIKAVENSFVTAGVELEDRPLPKSTSEFRRAVDVAGRVPYQFAVGPDYTMYLGDLLDGAARLQWPAQVLDFFTWKMP